MIESNMTQPTFRSWTKPTHTSSIGDEGVHGHVFRVDHNGELRPSEFRHRQGRPFSAKDVTFIKDFTEHVRHQHINDVYGLRLLDRDKEQDKLMEFCFDGTIVLVKACDVDPLAAEQIRGQYTAFAPGDGISQCKGNVRCAPHKEHGQYLVFVLSSSSPSMW